MSAVLSDRTITKLSDARVLELQDEYWNVMEEITPVLTTLKCATTVISSEDKVSISHTYPITFRLIHKHSRQKEESRRVMEFKAKLRESLEKHVQVS